MKTIILKPIYHRQQECIAIHFDNNVMLNNIVKKLPLARWSQTHKCWHVPLNIESYKNLEAAVKGNAVLEVSLLKAYLQKKKQVAATNASPPIKEIARPLHSSVAWKLSKENLHALEKFTEQLKEETSE